MKENHPGQGAEQPFNPTVVEYIVEAAFHSGPKVTTLTDPRISGVHGLSVEALTHILQTGNFRGRVGIPAHMKQFDLKLGDIYIHPNPALAPELTNTEDFITDNRIENAAGYAGDIARKHAMAVDLGIDLTDSHKVDMLTEIDTNGGIDDDIREQIEYCAKELGMPYTRVEAAYIKSLSRKGFLVALKFDRAEYGLQIGDGAGDLIVRRKDGKPVAYSVIFQIQPLGAYEARWLQQLRSQVQH